MIYFCVKFQKDLLYGVNLIFFAPWLPWQRPPEIDHHYILDPPFFVSMATAAKFVQPIPIFLAYLVPLDVDVVPIKFHQFLFGE
jgi:hypothetical protein